MDWTAIVVAAVGAVGTLGGWFLRELFNRLKEMDGDLKKLAVSLAELQLEVAKNYVTKNDHKAALDNIFNALRRIEDKMDDKVDK